MSDPLAFIARVWLVLGLVPALIGILIGLALALASVFVFARLWIWWHADTPDAAAARAFMAAVRLPANRRYAFVKGLRAVWGEGPFRVVP